MTAQHRLDNHGKCECGSYPFVSRDADIHCSDTGFAKIGSVAASGVRLDAEESSVYTKNMQSGA